MRCPARQAKNLPDSNAAGSGLPYGQREGARDAAGEDAAPVVLIRTSCAACRTSSNAHSRRPSLISAARQAAGNVTLHQGDYSTVYKGYMKGLDRGSEGVVP
eukprot:GHUV01035314.1.p1 GENE.GHUV01035314.1~~GHUV01035314.1.p1  ORF type:complete len:102 (+),score=15.73 GHUV01035314.1:62-367(+)